MGCCRHGRLAVRLAEVRSVAPDARCVPGGGAGRLQRRELDGQRLASSCVPTTGERWGMCGQRRAADSSIASAAPQRVSGHCATCRYCRHSAVVNERVTRERARVVNSCTSRENPRATISASEIAIRLFPSGANTITKPGRVNMACPVEASHTWALPSVLPVACAIHRG